MSETVIERRLEQQRDALPGAFEPRRRALAAFLEKGYPTRRDEAWRYTDLKPIAEGDFDLPGAALDPAARDRLRTRLDEAAPAASPGAAPAPRIVLVDGVVDDASSRTELPSGITLTRLVGDARFDRTGRDAAGTHPLALLNRAFASDGIHVHVAANRTADVPLEIFLVASGRGRIAQHPRIVIDLEANAALDVVVHCVDVDPAEGWVNAVFDVVQAEGSRLRLHRLQQHGDGLDHTSLLSARLDKDASLVAGYADLGGRVVRNDLDVELAGAGASADLFGVFVASTGRHVDNEIHIDHAAPHTTSDTAFRGIADRGGRGVFRGKLLVRPGAQKIDARQSSDNLLLAEQAEIDTRPELEIYADDVKCSHGATVGELDDEQMFYLRSRGLDDESARALLTFAFANTLLRRLEPAALRERAAARVAGGLRGLAEWETLR